MSKEKGIKSEHGFTMIELIIVIAIIGILSAILVPSFTSMSRKSRLRADISTIKQVQMQIDLFMAEHDGKFPHYTKDDDIAGDVPSDTKELTDKAVEALVKGGYIKKSDTRDSKEKEIRLQSKDVKLYYNDEKEHLELTFPTDSKEHKDRADMAESDKEWVSEAGYK